MIKWGVCGAGNIATQFVKTVQAYGGNVVAIASESEFRAKNFCEKYGLKKYYAGYEYLAKDSEIDAVYVATHHPYHAKCSALFLSSGKAVLCEKPLAINSEQFETMQTAAKKNNALLMEGMWTAFLPATKKVVETVKSGAIGKLRFIDIKISFNMIDRNTRPYKNELAGGCLLDIGVYALNYLYQLTGKFSEIVSISNIPSEFNVDETMSIILKNADGVICTVSSSVSLDIGRDCTVYGEKGKIIVPDFNGATKVIIEKEGKEEKYEFPYEYAFTEECMHFEGLYKEGRLESNVMSLERSAYIISVMDEIRKQWGLKFLPYEN